MSTSPDLALWERQDNETDEQWVAFRTYRDMWLPRRITCSAVRDVGTLYQWYDVMDWRRRALAYDSHIDRIKCEERENIERQTSAQRTHRQLQILQDAQELAANELRKLLAESSQIHASGKIKPSDIARLLDVAIRNTRLVLGESTSKIQIQDLSSLSTEELEALAALEEKIMKDSE